MILLCPNAEYDARLASHLLNLFPKAITNEAIRQSWDEGTIVDVRQGSTSRRIPGRGYELSSKYVHIRLLILCLNLKGCQRCDSAIHQFSGELIGKSASVP
jgi:hypothetical protein